MKKRVLCLTLCIVMVLAIALTGCKKKGETPVDPITATTLSMWVVTKNENGVDAETAALVSDAINNITNSRFKVRLVINWLTEDDYRAKMDQTIRDYIDVRANTPLGAATDATAETEVVEAETMVNEWGFTVIKYPDLLANQVDIVYIEGEDMYLDYIKKGWLFKMDDELSGASKKIKEYVNNALLSAAKREGGTYAIPNNHAIGKYTVMLLNKELMAETDMDAIYRQGKINGLFNENIYNYLQSIRYKNDPSIVPIASTPDAFLNLLAHYWDIDPDTLENTGDFSILGYHYNNNASVSRSTALRFDSLFTDEAFVDAFLKIKEYEYDGGYFNTPTEAQTAALTIKEMDYAEYISCKEDDSSAYYPVIIKNPTIQPEDVYGSMFGVCSKTVSTSHCMEILTFLNTNSEFRNLLQYGVEGETYRLAVDPADPNRRTVEYLPEHTYRMDVFKTGNAFIAYPDPDMDMNVWENGRLQNLAAAGADPMLDVDFRAIAEASREEAATPSAGSSGYTFTYTNGLGREILTQNPVLKKWIEEADAKGKGTYLFTTTETAMQNTTSLCYLYNNQYSGASTAAADENGNITVAFGGTSEGYELGLLSIYARRNANVTVNATVNGSAVALESKTHNQTIAVDLLNTNTYSIRVSTGIAKTSVATNDVIWNWIMNDCTAGDGVPQVLFSKKTVGETVKYTYLVYTTGMTKGYSVSAKPTGSDTVLNLELDFDESGKALGNNDVKYALWLVTVETASTVTEVNFSIVKDGSAATPVVTAAATDPSFTYCGTLDSELVRYISELNKAVNAEIAACDAARDFDALKTLTEELKRLLKPNSDLLKIPSKASFTALATLVAGIDMEELNYALLCATSNATVKHKIVDFNDMGDMVTKDITEDSATGEDYVLLDSPFRLYYLWLQSNGYVAKR